MNENIHNQNQKRYLWLFVIGAGGQLVGNLVLRMGTALFEVIGGFLIGLSLVCLGAFIYLATTHLKKARTQ